MQRPLRTPARRLACALLALLFLAAQLVDLGHRTRTEHVLCAEHGEFEHTSRSETLAGDHASEDGPSARPAPLDAPLGESHEHCCLVHLKRDLAQVPGFVPSAAWVPPAPTRVAARPAEPIRGRIAARPESARGPPRVA